MKKINLKIAMAQINQTVCDFTGNLDNIFSAIDKSDQSDIIVFPELSISGYYPQDLMLSDRFISAQQKSIDAIIDKSASFPNLHIIIGFVRKSEVNIGKKIHNSLAVIKNGKIVFIYDKMCLPTYDVFDEARHFEPGRRPGIFKANINNQDLKIGFLICEDGWSESIYRHDPTVCLPGVDLVISINASPSDINKDQKRARVFSDLAKKLKSPIFYVNQIGGMDEIVFDGASFAFDDNGELIVKGKSFEQDFLFFDFNNQEKTINPSQSGIARAHQQIVLGLRDYIHKTGFKKVLVGCSGGVDSALVLTLATQALGSDNVEAITMPTKFSSDGSISDSAQLCKNLGIKLHHMPIQKQFEDALSSYYLTFGTNPSPAAVENIQARIRGMNLMSRSNSTGAMLLTTGNKSEASVGYCTLYGDTNGGFNPIGDLYKTDVFAMCRFINASIPLIPNQIIEKPPSAELSENQLDSDSLPEYGILDAILKLEIEPDSIIEPELSEAANIVLKTEKAVIDKVKHLIHVNEFKRRQSPPIIKVRAKSFGIGRRIPIAKNKLV